MRKLLSVGMVFSMGMVGLAVGVEGCIFGSDSEECGGVTTYIHVTNGLSNAGNDLEVSVKGLECQKKITVPKLTGEFATLMEFGVRPGERLTFVVEIKGENGDPLQAFSDVCDVPDDVAERVNEEGDVVGEVSIFSGRMECLGEVVGEGTNPRRYIRF